MRDSKTDIFSPLKWPKVSKFGKKVQFLKYLSKIFAWQVCHWVGVELLIYVERFCDKKFKGIENDLQLLQGLKKLAYFWKFDHFAARITVLYQFTFAVMADAVVVLCYTILTIILYEVVKCRIKGLAHWVWAQGPSQGALINKGLY